MKVVVTSNSTKIAQRYRNMARHMPGLVNQAMHDLVQTEAVPLFGKTVATWTHKPTFEAVQSARGWAVEANPEYPYGWVNRGVARRTITAHGRGYLWFAGPYHAKTKPNVISSFKGGRGNVWSRPRKVKWPGIEARNFSDIIMRRIQVRAAGYVRDRLNQASYGAGQGI